MFICQEIQTNNNVAVFLPPEQYQTRPALESAFYLKCGSAVISSVEIHTVMCFTEEGFVIPELTKCFKHDVQPQPEPEPEPDPVSE